MIETFEQSCQWLFSLHRFGIKLGLEQTRKLAELCGNPDSGLKFIHIAGTNGKGSTGAMLERVLRAKGFKTGFFSSPHLVSACERMRVDGKAVAESEFVAAAQKVCQAVEKMLEDGSSPTYFEAVTVMALHIFQKEKCDYIIWETGMGGRLDSTNIVQPLISVITNIAMDHEKFLGGSLAEIAAEKSGIIKPGVPVAVGAMPEEAEAVIRRQAQKSGSEYLRSMEIAPLEMGSAVVKPAYQSFICGGEKIELHLNGIMQQRNAQLVITVLKHLAMWDNESRQALKLTRWPARIDLIGSRRFLLDGGHNPDGLSALAEALKVLYPGKKFDFIFGAFADKDFSGGLQIIAPLVRNLHAVGFAEYARLSAAPEEIIRVAGELGIKDCCAVDDLRTHLQKVAASEDTENVPAVIAGSLYLAGEVLEILEPPEYVLDL